MNAGKLVLNEDLYKMKICKYTLDLLGADNENNGLSWTLDSLPLKGRDNKQSK